MEEPDELDKYIDSLINFELEKLVNREIGPYTCQFLKQDITKALIPFASGVLAKLNGAYYIITASHVIEDWSDSNQLFIETEDDFMSVVGKGCGTEIEKKERIDIAYIKLKDSVIPLLNRWYRFLSINGFLYPEKVFLEANYCVFGYPAANPKNVKGKTVGAAYFVRPHQDKVFDYYGLDPLSHYILEFKGRAKNIITNQDEKIKVEHYGLSGGGLWYTVIEHNG